MVFSFNHSPIISAFAVDQKRRYGQNADQRSSQILSRAHLLMVVMVLFFVFSCVLTLSPEQLAEAKPQVATSLLLLCVSKLSDPVRLATCRVVVAFLALSFQSADVFERIGML